VTDRLSELLNDERDIVMAADIAPILGVTANSIRRQADIEPGALGFRVIRIGERTLIPRVPFIRFILGEEANNVSSEQTRSA